MSLTLARRLLGGTLVLFSLAPIFRLLDAEDDNFRRAGVEAAEATLAYVQTAAITVLLLGVVAAFIVPRARLLGIAERGGSRIGSVTPSLWAAVTAGLGFVLAVSVNRRLYQGLFTTVDEMASFVHARYLASGDLAGTLPSSPDAWLIPNMLVVESGWVSQFPPSHLVLLATFARTGVPTLVGPALFATMVGFATLSLVRLMPDHPRATRLAGVLVACSPFLVFLGAGGLSHVSAGAFLWLALYAALRARDDSWHWSFVAGAAIGMAVTSRPWVGVLLGTLGTLGVWLPHLRDRAAPGSAIRWLARRCVGTVLAGIPFALGLGWYNQVLFGGPANLGYLAAFGERHKLGFHADPWGNPYTPLDAVGFTSTDLVAFGTQLLETPIPVGVAIGLWLIFARTLPRGAAFLLSFSLVPVVGNMLYWFHGTRMLYEAAPAWLALGCLALAPLFRDSSSSRHRSAPRAPELGNASTPPDAPDPPDAVEPSAGRRRLDILGVATWTALSALGMAAVLGIPDRVASYAWDEDLVARLSVPELPGGAPSLVFVHTSWDERLSARLQGTAGMRQDSVNSALRRNTSCGLHEFTDARAAGESRVSAALPRIDLRQVPGAPAELLRPPSPDGTTLRTREGERFSPGCTRELRADRFGAVALAPLLWQGDLPGLENGAPLFVRDLGPEANAVVVEHYADRQPWVFVPTQPGGPPELVPYREAMQVLWGS